MLWKNILVLSPMILSTFFLFQFAPEDPSLPGDAESLFQHNPWVGQLMPRPKVWWRQSGMRYCLQRHAASPELGDMHGGIKMQQCSTYFQATGHIGRSKTEHDHLNYFIQKTKGTYYRKFHEADFLRDAARVIKLSSDTQTFRSLPMKRADGKLVTNSIDKRNSYGLLTKRERFSRHPRKLYD